MIFACDCVGAHYVGGIPFRHPPVENQALVNEIIHGAHRLFNRGCRVGAMAEEEVKIVKLQPFQGAAACFVDVFA